MEDVKPKKTSKKKLADTKEPTRVKRTIKKKQPEELVVIQEQIPDIVDEYEDITDLDACRKMLQIHQSATSRHLEFGLTFATVKKLISAKRCYYTGREFSEHGQFGRSFDRRDNTKGYIEGNVVPCTVDFNHKKGNLTKEEIIILYNKVILGE